MRGRIVVRDAVVQKVAEHVAATAVHAPPRRVRVSVGGSPDGVIVNITAPVPVPALDDTEAIAAATSVLDTAASVQRDVQQRLSSALGQDVIRVNLTVNGASAPQRRRVR